LAKARIIRAASILRCLTFWRQSVLEFLIRVRKRAFERTRHLMEVEAAFKCVSAILLYIQNKLILSLIFVWVANIRRDELQQQKETSACEIQRYKTKSLCELEQQKIDSACELQHHKTEFAYEVKHRDIKIEQLSLVVRRVKDLEQREKALLFMEKSYGKSGDSGPVGGEVRASSGDLAVVVPAGAAVSQTEDGKLGVDDANGNKVDDSMKDQRAPQQEIGQAAGATIAVDVQRQSSAVTDHESVEEAVVEETTITAALAQEYLSFVNKELMTAQRSMMMARADGDAELERSISLEVEDMDNTVTFLTDMFLLPRLDPQIKFAKQGKMFSRVLSKNPRFHHWATCQRSADSADSSLKQVKNDIVHEELSSRIVSAEDAKAYMNTAHKADDRTCSTPS